MKKILLFEANSSQALSVARFIQKNSDYYLVGCIERNIRFVKKYYDEIIVCNFLDIVAEDYDFVLPMGANTSLNILNKYKKLHYKNDIYTSINNLIAYEKPKMLEIVKDINVPIPETFISIKNIKEYPIFYKENFENGGGIRGVAYSEADIPNHNHLIYQEYIDTPSTYGVGFLAKEGEILTFLVYKEVISYPIEGGSSVVIELFNDEKLLKYTKKIIKEINYNGWGLAEYKYCNKKDDFFFMEINAKFWASIEFMLENNSKFLELLLEIKYNSTEVKRMIFINRLLQYNFFNIVRSSKYLFNSKWITEGSISYVLLRKFVPDFMVGFLKRIFK